MLGHASPDFAAGQGPGDEWMLVGGLLGCGWDKIGCLGEQPWKQSDRSGLAQMHNDGVCPASMAAVASQVSDFLRFPCFLMQQAAAGACAMLLRGTHTRTMMVQLWLVYRCCW